MATITKHMLLDETEQTNILYGKTLLVIGDSISDSNLTQQASYKYFKYLQDKDGMNIIEDGWTGTGYVRNYADKLNIPNRIRNYTFETPDYVSIFAGTNDWFGDTGKGTCDLGQFGDTYESGTFYGYLEQTYTLLIDKYPTSKVLIALPIHRAWETSPNDRGNTLEEFVEAIRKVAHKYSFTIIDLYNEGAVNPLIAKLRETYFTMEDGSLDGTHPNNLGHARLYPKFREGLIRS